MVSTRRTQLYDKLDAWTELPMLVLSAAMVPLLLGPLIFTGLPSGVERAFLIVDWCIWGAFAAELGFKTYLAKSRLEHLKGHWIDVLIVALPLLRPLRIIQSARALRLLRLVRLAAFLDRAFPSVRLLLVRHGLQYVLVVGLFLVLGGAVLITALERGEGRIEGLGDGIWWAVTTISTVGYGDTFPVTAGGRVVGATLMLGGVSIFGAVAANLASFLVSRDRTQTVDDAKLDQIIQRLDHLEHMLVNRADT